MRDTRLYEKHFCAIAVLLVAAIANGVGAAEGTAAAVHAKVLESYVKNREAELAQYRARLKTERTVGDLLVTMSSLGSFRLSTEQGVPLYSELLGHWCDEVRQNALHALAGYGANGSGAADAIFVLFTNPQTTVNSKIAAARCLANIAADKPATVSALMEAMDNRYASWRLKQAAADGLGQIGRPAAASVPALTRQLQDEETRAAYAAFRALGRVAGQRVEPVTISSAAPADAAAVLERLQHTSDAKAIGALLDALSHEPEKYLRVGIIETLGTAGASPRAALRAVLGEIPNADEFISSTAINALNRFKTNDLTCVAELGNHLGHGDPKVRYHAAVALGKFRAAALPALPRVIEELEAVSRGASHFRVAALLQIVRGIGPSASAAGGVIVRMLPERAALYRNYGDFEVHHLRAFMLVTLSEIGVPSDALPFVLDGLANSDARSLHLYTAAAMAARAMGPAARQAVPFLMRAVEGKLPEHNLTFERYLAAFTAPGNYTTPRLEAIRALGAIGDPAAPAVPALESIARQEITDEEALSPSAAAEARNALAKLRQ